MTPEYTLMATRDGLVYGISQIRLPSKTPPRNAEDAFVNPTGQFAKFVAMPDSMSIRTIDAASKGIIQTPPRPSFTPPKKALVVLT
jgi:hypothetical protein